MRFNDQEEAKLDELIQRSMSISKNIAVYAEQNRSSLCETDQEIAEHASKLMADLAASLADLKNTEDRVT